MAVTNASPRLTMPPWLWVWLAGYLLPGIPGQIGGIHYAIATYFRPPGTSAPLPTGLATVELLSAIFEALVNALAAAGVVVVIFPQLRGSWVERRFNLVDPDDQRDVISDAMREVIAEMQRFVDGQFVDGHAQSIRLRVSLRVDQMARIYPVGWRTARIAVFRPLMALWESKREGDREAAKAILLHEVAHGRQGDHLITGLGSPFVWLVRIGAPAYLLLSLIPATVYLAAGGDMASFATSAPDVVLIPATIFLPVTALWLAEFHADQQAAQAIGPGALQRALLPASGPGASLAARAIALLSHPPRRLRLRRAAAPRSGAVVLMAAWPAALATLFLLLLGMDMLGVPWLSIMRRIADVWLKSMVHALAVEGRPVLIATAVVLLAWPALTAPWERLWSSRLTRPHTPRSGRNNPPWWPYLATACLPIGLLLLSLAPPQVNPREAVRFGLTQGPRRTCAPITDWALGGGIGRTTVAQAAFIQLLRTMQAGDDTRVIAADARLLDTEVRTVLANPPPGAARFPYTEAMTGYRTAAQEFMHGNIPAGKKTVDEATRAFSRYEKVLTDCMGLRPPATSPTPSRRTSTVPAISPAS